MTIEDTTEETSGEKVNSHCRNCEKPFQNGDMISYNFITGEAFHYFPLELMNLPEFHHLIRAGHRPCSEQFENEMPQVVKEGVFHKRRVFDPSQIRCANITYKKEMLGVEFPAYKKDLK
ncbi:MAG: hypothetical protein ABIH72_05915 [archaeon]